MIMNKKHLGFTLWELIIGLTLMSIMAAITYPIFGNIKSSLSLKEAKTKAHILNCAKQSYKMGVGSRSSDYANSVSQEDKFQLIAPYMPDSARNFSEFAPDGYFFELGDTVDAPVVLFNPDGSAIPYD